MKKFVCLTRLHTRAILFILLYILYFNASTVLCVAQDSPVEEEETVNWTIAASAFESNMNQDEAAALIPRYVLENIPSMRAVTSGEHYRRAKKNISIELQELYQNLQEKNVERDSLFLTNTEEKVLEEALESKEREMLEINQKIKEKKEEDNALSEADFSPTEEQIMLWNNDASNLYTLPEKVSVRGPDDIHALITGSIQRIDSFIHVKASLALYPGAVIVAEVTEIDSMIAIEELSARLLAKLYAAIVNVPMVTLTFNVAPPEAVANTVVRINANVIKANAISADELFDSNGEPIERNEVFATTTLPSGIYNLYVESPGYRSASTTYDFSGGTEFDVQVNLEQDSGTLVHLTFPTVVGNVYVNALSAQQETIAGASDSAQQETIVDASDSAPQTLGTAGSIVINNFPALGEFIHENGITTWFVLTDPQGPDISYLSFPVEFSFVPDTIDFSDRIEKSRRRMYHSWAALIVSLPLSFIAHGQYTNEHNSWAIGNSSGKNIQAWNIARYATMGVSIGLGINWLVQLGLYLYSANAVLPKELEPLRD